MLTINANTVADPPEIWDQSWTVYRGAKTKITILSRGVDGVSKPFDFTCNFPILPNGTLSEVWGILNLYPSTYTSSKIKPPQDRDDLSNPLPRKANFELTYKSSSAPSPDEAEGITVVGTDSFRFQLNDTKTSLLSNGVFNITILNHIYSSDQDLAALEDSNVTLTVQYTDKMKEQDNDLPHSARVVVESLPDKGTLYYGGTAVQAGAVVPSVQLSYVAAPLNWYGSTSFTFHVRVCSNATDPCTGDLWYSGRHTATIVVAPVDDPPILTFNESLNSANINANGYFSLMTSKTQYKTFNISISDVEGDGLYTVRVSSVSGSGWKGSLRFDPPPLSTGVTTDKYADDPYYSPQVFGGNLTQIQAALTDFKVYGATSGYPNITVEIWSKPLSDWSSYDAADFRMSIPTEVVEGTTTTDPPSSSGTAPTTTTTAFPPSTSSNASVQEMSASSRPWPHVVLALSLVAATLAMS
eukprot:g79461.t1